MRRIDYDDWEHKRLSTLNLRLDWDNPRIPSHIRNSGLRQPTIREYLITNEDVQDLAESISKHGYIPHDPIYAIKEKEHYIIVEGNRRTCALQLLLDPDIAPKNKQNIFRRYAQSIVPSTIEKLSIIIAPSRNDARTVLYLRHAVGHKKWGRQQKNNFIASGILAGKTIEDISAELKESPSQISTAVTEVLLQRMALDVGLSTDEEDRAISHDFELSTLSRIVNTSKFKEKTGIHIKEASLRTSLSEDKFKRIFRRIFQDLLIPIEKGGQNSRTLSSVEARDNYIETIFSEEKAFPEESDKPFVYAPFSKPTVHLAVAQPEQPIKKSKRTVEMLIPRDEIYITGNEKLDMIIQEAQKMQPTIYPLAGAFILRSIFELAVLRIFEKNGQLTRALNDKGRPNSLSSNVAALLRKKEWFSNPSYCDSLTSFCSTDNSIWTTLETLNRYVHTQYTIPDKESLKVFWNMIKPLIEECSKK